MATQVEQLDMALDAANRDRNQAMLEFAKRIYAPILAEFESANQALGQRVQRAEAELAAADAQNAELRRRLEQADATNAELACDYIQARRRANELKKRGLALLAVIRNEREARCALEILVSEYEAHGQIAPVPIVGELSAATTEADWKAIWAGVESGR